MKKNGFTLIELMTIVAMIGIVVVVIGGAVMAWKESRRCVHGFVTSKTFVPEHWEEQTTMEYNHFSKTFETEEETVFVPDQWFLTIFDLERQKEIDRKVTQIQFDMHQSGKEIKIGNCVAEVPM